MTAKPFSLSRCADKSCYLIYKGVDENGKELRSGGEIDDFISRLKPNLLNHDKNYPAGDFRSLECIELLKQADVVVTNPPFSLFREYVAQLVEYDKKFLIIGHQNAITYKEIFKLIKDNQIWLGCFSMSKDMVFSVPPENAHLINPKDKEKAERLGYKGNFTRLGSSCWFTNLPHKKRNEILETIYNYDPQKYPKYDNYDAINVDKTAEIPLDYEGVMGVPITFLDKYNSAQFEIIGMGEDNGRGFSGGVWLGGSCSCLVNGKAKFKRIFIKNKIPRGKI